MAEGSVNLSNSNKSRINIDIKPTICVYCIAANDNSIEVLMDNLSEKWRERIIDGWSHGGVLSFEASDEEANELIEDVNRSWQIMYAFMFITGNTRDTFSSIDRIVSSNAEVAKRSTGIL